MVALVTPPFAPAHGPGGTARGVTDEPWRRRLRLRTQVRLRWLAVLGQLITVLVAWLGLDFPFPIGACLTVIAASALLNLLFELRRERALRLTPSLGFFLLVFDVVQLCALLFLTGGAENPFLVLVVGPVIISATTLPGRHTAALAVLTVALVSLLALVSYPLPWHPGQRIVLPDLLVLANWSAVLATLGFVTVYAWKVAEENRELGEALTATELALEREQHLSALDGLAAGAAHELGTPLATIALVAKEMERALPPDDPSAEDVALIRSQAQRCREILQRLTSLSSEDQQLATLGLRALVDEIVSPHREFGVEIETDVAGEGPEPTTNRNAGVLHGLGNLVENAVDFAETRMTLRGRWDADRVELTITDDGPGFPPELAGRIGEPYISRRGEGGETAARQGGGLGLGVFIAKTLLERSGATVSVSDASFAGRGASVRVAWPRAAFERGTRSKVGDWSVAPPASPTHAGPTQKSPASGDPPWLSDAAPPR